MPPKQRFGPQDVIEAAYRVVRKQGWKKFSARTIASELNSSTQPIYDHFNSMENIEAEVIKKALAYFIEFMSRDITGDKWLDQALGYVIFAEREKHLFQYINDEKHAGLQKQLAQQHWIGLGDKLSNDERFKDMPAEKMNQIRGARWIMVHGLAYLVSNGWFEAQLSEDSVFSKEMGFSLIEFIKKVNNGLYEEFKKE